MEGKQFFVMEHGIDNYEVWIDLSEVSCIKVSSVYEGSDPNQYWRHNVLFVMNNGNEIKEVLTDKGMQDLADVCSVSGWDRK